METGSAVRSLRGIFVSLSFGEERGSFETRVVHHEINFVRIMPLNFASILTPTSFKADSQILEFLMYNQYNQC